MSDALTGPELAIADGAAGVGTGGRWRAELGTVVALWKRDLVHLVRQRSRWSGVVLQPLVFWLVIGSGMSSVFTLPGTGVDYLTYFFPGILAMVVLFTAVFATMSVIEDRKSGFLQQVMVAPSSRAALVVGKALGVTTMASIQVGACMLVAPWAGVSLGEVSWFALASTVLFGCAGLTALNFVMAWLIDSTAGYHAIMSVVLLPMWMLSGAMFPASEGWTEVVMVANPMAYMVDAMRHALAGGESAFARADLATSLVVLAVLAVVFVALATAVARRRAEGARV
jgi:daunorubicin resistance ABC transporter membrane protein